MLVVPPPNAITIKIQIMRALLLIVQGWVKYGIFDESKKKYR
jgi:hypothetical protein